MLQVNRLQAVTEPSLPPETSSPAEVVTTFIQLVHRQFPIILIVTFFCTMLGFVYLMITPASYTSLATMIIDTKRSPMFQQSPQGMDLAVESNIVASQVEILKSEKIALAVINEYKLADDPEFIGPGRGLLGMAAGIVNSLTGNEVSQTPEARTRRALDTFQDRMVA